MLDRFEEHALLPGETEVVRGRARAVGEATSGQPLERKALSMP